MKLTFKEDQSEEYYRKLLLLNKVKPFLNTYFQKSYIFNLGYCWDILFNDKDIADLSYTYARDILKGRFPKGEKIISKSPWRSYLYARDIIDGPFPQGEKAIATDAQYSLWYAQIVLNSKFPLGEKAISEHTIFASIYAMDILKDRFIMGEDTILNSRHRDTYLKFLESIGKRNEVNI